MYSMVVISNSRVDLKCHYKGEKELCDGMEVLANATVVITLGCVSVSNQHLTNQINVLRTLNVHNVYVN